MMKIVWRRLQSATGNGGLGDQIFLINMITVFYDKLGR